MLVETAPQSNGARILRRSLPFAVAGLVAVAMITGYSLVFAQDITSDADKLDQSANIIWMLGAFLVFFMQAGFAFLGAGLIRAKNTTNYMTKSFMDFTIASLSFWAFGFALMWGTSQAGIAGNTNYFLTDAADGQTYVDFVFQMVFAGTAATIVAGAVAERTKTQAYLAYSFIIGAIIYPLYGHWAWNEAGWLGALDKIDLPAAADYAGSGVVHAVGGFVALAGAVVVGPRIGKFNADGSANVISGHNVGYVVIGTFILFFGWFGFNINTGDSIGLNAINTLMAGATGSIVALYIRLVQTGKTDILIACNGALAGLVGITAGAAFVEPWSAVVIGAIAAPIMMASLLLIERVFKIDDPVGAISVHGVTGLWGLLAVGIFANGNNGVEGLVVGEGKQILSQLISMGVVLAWGLVTGFALFMLLKVTMGVRATEAEELEGLDISEHGLPAYGDD
ncbi:MAG: ammonium transporter [Dehalococcoidia bacterium]|nr:ammonium transporter [Dehalococcoidia bacterium]